MVGGEIIRQEQASKFGGARRENKKRCQNHKASKKKVGRGNGKRKKHGRSKCRSQGFTTGPRCTVYRVLLRAGREKGGKKPFGSRPRARSQFKTQDELICDSAFLIDLRMEASTELSASASPILCA